MKFDNQTLKLIFQLLFCFLKLAGIIIGCIIYKKNKNYITLVILIAFIISFLSEIIFGLRFGYIIKNSNLPNIASLILYAILSFSISLFSFYSLNTRNSKGIILLLAITSIALIYLKYLNDFNYLHLSPNNISLVLRFFIHIVIIVECLFYFYSLLINPPLKYLKKDSIFFWNTAIFIELCISLPIISGYDLFNIYNIIPNIFFLFFSNVIRLLIILLALKAISCRPAITK